jgi:cardiolipin synthase
VAAGLLYSAPTLGSTAAERFFALSLPELGRRCTSRTRTSRPTVASSICSPPRLALGVDVRILTAGPRTDVHVVRLAGRAWYETLLAAGVRVYEWQPTTLHAKTFVVDEEWFTVGSMNFDNRSMALNDEATLMVLDRRAGQNMNRIFHDDLRHAEEITLQAFRRRSWLQRVGEWCANSLTRLLLMPVVGSSELIALHVAVDG